MAVTMLLFGTSAAASSMALHAAIDRLRKKWSLPAMNSVTAATSPGAVSVRSSAGARRLSSSDDAATLRLCTSSPMCSACAISGFSSMPPRLSSAAASAGASTAASQRSRSSTSGLLAPKRSTLPRPSLKLQ